MTVASPAALVVAGEVAIGALALLLVLLRALCGDPPVRIVRGVAVALHNTGAASWLQSLFV